MKLHPYARDYDAFLTELSAVIDADTTRFYLDTSVLMFLVRVGRATRQEFLTWCRKRTDHSVRVPVWAAHEFHKHVVENTVSQNIKRSFSEVESTLHDLLVLALERVDDQVCQSRGYASRAHYMSEMSLSLTNIRRLMKVAREQSDLSENIDNVIAYVNESVLSTDLTPIVMRLSDTGEFRYNHLIPPGYKDKKELNRYGDVVIWEEIVSDVCNSGTADETTACVLLSCDEKTDWISKAHLLRRSHHSSIEKPNKDKGYDVVRPHPLLVHELDFRTRNGGFYVLHPRSLALVASHIRNEQGKDLGLVLLRDALFEHDPLEMSYRDVATEGGGHSSLVSVVGRSQSPASGSKTERSTQDSMERPSIAELMALSRTARMTLDVVTSDAAPKNDLDKLLSVLKAKNVTPFELGRLLGEVIVAKQSGWSIDATILIERLKDNCDSLTTNRVVLGTIATAYFDRYGDLLLRPDSTLSSVALSWETDDFLQDAFRALRSFLKDADAQLPYLPGTERSPVEYVVDAIVTPNESARTIQDIRLEGHTVLVDHLPRESSRLLSNILGMAPIPGCTGQIIRSVIAREFAVPPDLLSNNYDKFTYTWVEGSGLVCPNTASPGGLSSTAGEEEHRG